MLCSSLLNLSNTPYHILFDKFLLLTLDPYCALGMHLKDLVFELFGFLQKEDLKAVFVVV